MTKRTTGSEVTETPARGSRGDPDRTVVDLTRPKRRRRPTGAPAPLPKKIGLTGKLWLAAVFVVAISGSIWLHATTRPLDRFDAVIARFVVALRAGWLDSVARALNAVGSRWGLAALGLLAVALAMVFRRWRHLIVFLVSLAVL